MPLLIAQLARVAAMLTAFGLYSVACGALPWLLFGRQ